MLVVAKWQVAYKNISYRGGEVFDIDADDYPKYAGDVKILPEPEPIMYKGGVVKATRIEDIEKQLLRAKNKMLKKKRNYKSKGKTK